MPTGYTSIIEDREGTTFAEYAWRCARAFGALIELREDSLDAPIPEAFRPSEYSTKRLAEAQAELARLRGLTANAAEVAAGADHHAAVKEWERSEKDRRAKLARYDAIRREASAWTPPTIDHAGLQRFMLQQIDTSTEFMREERARPEGLSGAVWLERRIASAARDIEYHTKELREERERVAKRNEWVAALRRSIPPPKGKTP